MRRMSGNESAAQRLSIGKTDPAKLSLKRVVPIAIPNRNKSTFPPPQYHCQNGDVSLHFAGLIGEK